MQELAGFADWVVGIITGETAERIMKILSLNVGLPREVTWQRRLVTTGIFKEPVNAPVMLRALNLDGDRQADLTVHGGVTKAVYAYPSEHYGYWRTECPEPVCLGACSEKISRRRDYWKKAFTSGTDFVSPLS